MKPLHKTLATALGVVITALALLRVFSPATAEPYSEQKVGTFVSQSGRASVDASLQPNVVDGAILVKLEGVGYEGIRLYPWTLPYHSLVQWLPGERYVTLDGGLVDTKTGSVERLEVGCNYNPHAISVLGDGTLIAMAAENTDRGVVQVFLIPTDTMIPVALSEDPPLNSLETPERWVAWDAQGRLYFDSCDGEQVSLKVYDPKNGISVLKPHAGLPMPSPDGEYLAYIQMEGGYATEWQVMSVETGDVICRTGRMGVLSWTRRPGAFTIHLGDQIALFDIRQSSPIRAHQLPGLVGFLSDDGSRISVRCVIKELTTIRELRTVSLPIE